MNSKANTTLRRALHLYTRTTNNTKPPSHHNTQRLRLRPNHFSSSTPPPPDAASIVQGPSLLVNTGVSLYRPSPSLFLLPGLRSLPFWTAPPLSKSKVSIAYNDPTVTKAVKHLEENYETIQKEYMAAVMGVTETNMSEDRPNVTKPLQPDYDVNRNGAADSEKLHGGTWDWHSYVLGGEVQPGFVRHCPETARILRELEPFLFFDVNANYGDEGEGVEGGERLESTNPFGFCFYSTLGPKSYIKPHTGPMNLRLRLHLPLIVPSDTKPDAYSIKPQTKCGIRVGDQIRSWEEGKVVVLDDSYEHEVWNETEELRVLLLVDIWHPDVKKEERSRIGKMFGYAVEQGWLGKGGPGGQ